MTAKKLSKHEDAVLLFLYEQKDKTPPSTEEIVAATRLSRTVVKGALETLREKGMISGPPRFADEVAAVLHQIEPNLKPTDTGYAEHTLMLASLYAGADESRLAEALGYDREFVGVVGSRLRSGGIWAGNELAPGKREEWEADAIAFWLDGAVAMGTLNVIGSGKDRRFQMTESGLKDAAKLIRGASS